MCNLKESLTYVLPSEAQYCDTGHSNKDFVQWFKTIWDAQPVAL